MLFQFRKSIHNRGAHANIDLEVEYIAHRDNKLNFEYLDSTKWGYICNAGAEIFFDYFNTKNKGTLNIKINSVDELPGDTNSLIVLFATISAISAQLQFSIPGLLFDLESESFVLPEARTMW